MIRPRRRRPPPHVAGLIAGGVRAVRASPPMPGAVAAEDAIFEIGSVTKALTGVLLADMALRGEVALDDPLSAHLRGPRPAWRGREPTLVELATHRSGLPNVPGPLGRRELLHVLGLRRADPWAGVTAAGYAHLVGRESPRRPPGGTPRYSSLGVALLGEALAARAGRPYGDLLAERVLAPLGMASTGLAVAPALRHRLLRGHTRRGRPAPPLADHLAPAGALRASAADVLRLLGACLEPPPGPLGRALELAATPHADGPGGVRFGLCWLVVEARGRPRTVWHDGGTWGFRSFAAFVPGRDAAAVVLSSTARSVDRLGFTLLEEALRR